MIDGARLKALRKQHKMTTERLAQLIGITRQQIVRYEAGNAGMNTETLKRIALTLNVSTDYLLGLTDTPRHNEQSRITGTIDLMAILERVWPEDVARFIVDMGIDVQPNPLHIDPRALLDHYPPALVARFLDELDIVKRDDD